MSKSLDPTILSQSITPKSEYTGNEHQNGIVEKCLEDISSPLQALSKLVPVPESLMSPDYRPTPIIGRINTSLNTPHHRIPNKTVQPVRSPKPSRIATIKPKSAGERRSNHNSPNQQRKINNNVNTKELEKSIDAALKKSLSSEDESEICPAKLQTIQMKVEERRQHRDNEMHITSDDRVERAAVYIQKMWRGYYVRNKNKYVQELFKNLQSQRSDQYIKKLATDMESTKVALESERKIQMLQMQAINALWKKVSTIHPDGESTNVLNSSTAFENSEIVKDLAQTCNMLHSQIQQLQGSMQDIIKYMATFSQTPNMQQQLNDKAIATQTEISAVHTPQGEAGKTFPFQKQTRPSSLPLPMSQHKQTNNDMANQELKQYAGSLVDGVIKTVSENKSEIEDEFETVESEENVGNND